MSEANRILSKSAEKVHADFFFCDLQWGPEHDLASEFLERTLSWRETEVHVAIRDDRRLMAYSFGMSSENCAL